MAADGLVQAVRGQLRLGRLLPLGGPADGVWIAERAAAAVLGEAERAVPGVRLGRVRIALADPDAHDWGGVRTANPAAPPGALPAGPLLVEADFAARADRPLPRTAASLRAVLTATAADRLGLEVAVVDLRVTGLLDGDEPAPEPGEATTVPAEDGPREADPVLDAALAVPGVTSAASRLPGPEVRVHVTVDAGYRALDVALAVRAAVAGVSRASAIAVVVTGVADMVA